MRGRTPVAFLPPWHRIMAGLVLRKPQPTVALTRLHNCKFILRASLNGLFLPHLSCMLQYTRPHGPLLNSGTGGPPRGPTRAAEALCVLVDEKGKMVMPGIYPKRDPTLISLFLPRAGHTSYTTMRKAHLVSKLGLRHRDIRALEPGVALPC